MPADLKKPPEVASLLALLDEAPVMIAEVRSDLIYTYVNAAYADLHHLRPDEIIGRHYTDIVRSELVERVLPSLEAAIDGKTVEFSFQFNEATGRHRYLNVKYMPKTIDGEDMSGAVLVGVDITDQTLLAEQAERLDERLKAAHAMSVDGFMVFRSIRNPAGSIADFEIEYCNEAGANICGRSISEIVGERLLTVFPGNEVEQFFAAYCDVVESGVPFQTTRFYNHDDLNFWVEISATKLGDGVAIAFADVSERKANELAVVEHADRLQRVLDNIVAFVGVLSPEGIVLEVNQSALDLADLRREDVLGKPFWETYWVSHDRALQERMKQSVRDAAGGKTVRFDICIRVLQGRPRWIDYQIAPRYDGQGRVAELIPSGGDIHDRKVAEDHRELLVNELNHRVKNSLATIQALARQTIRFSPDMDAFERSFTARLKAIALAHDILTSSDDARALLETLIERQVRLYTGDIQQVRYAGDRIYLSGDAAHNLGLVLHELATNAAKYGALSVADGFVEIEARYHGHDQFKLVWREVGGPPAEAPAHAGFGSRLIVQSVEHSLNGTAEFDYAPTGLSVSLILPREGSHERQ